jgi:mRNA-degrading endonuclease RelE of RelBE toxin-antitoxin system
LAADKPYTQLAYPKYNKIKKKLPSPLIKCINTAENRVAHNPFIGTQKQRDLKGIYIYKFKPIDQEYLLAYQVNKKTKEVIFIAIGGHENFYRDLKHYLK